MKKALLQALFAARRIPAVKKCLLLFCSLMVCFLLCGCGAISAMLGIAYGSSEVEVYEDVSEYARFAGANPEERYRIQSPDLKGGVFPAAVTEEMTVQDFRMVYYNPFDAQWLCYLTVTYPESAYAKEAARLAAMPKADYQGVFSVSGFAAEPLAISVDRSSGFLYAIPTPGQTNTITYVRLEFGNLFLDLDWTEYVPAQYLPIGFDASEENPWRAAYLAAGEP